MDGDPQGDGGTADEGRDSNKMKKNGESVYVRERERERKGESDRVMEEILLKVMNVSLSFLLCDPGAFANYPGSHGSGPLSPSHWGKAPFQSQTLALL